MLGLLVGDARGRRDRAHATRIGAGATLADALVVAGARQRHGGLAVAEREHRPRGALHALLDHERGAGFAERSSEQVLRRLLGLGRVVADDHALACGQAVGLHHAAATELRDRVARLVMRGDSERLGRVDASGLEQLLREGLRALHLRGRGTRAEDRDALLTQPVGEAEHERYLGPDDDEIDAELLRERDLAIDVIDLDRVALTHHRDTGVTRRGVHLEAVRARGDDRDERVFAPAGTDDKTPQRALRATASMPCGART